MPTDIDTVSGSGFRHEALFYSGDDEFLAGTVPFVLEGVETGEPVLVVVPEPRLAALRTALETFKRIVAATGIAMKAASTVLILTDDSHLPCARSRVANTLAAIAIVSGAASQRCTSEK